MDLLQLYESNKDAISMWEIFKDKLNWSDPFGNSTLITDANPKNLYEIIGKNIKHIYDKIPEHGMHPHQINLI